MKNYIDGPPKTWKKALLMLALTSLFSYVFFMGVYFVTSEPAFCNSCHEVKPYVPAWKVSVHKEVKCLYCHEFRGFLGKLHSKARGLNYVYQQWTGQYSTVLSKALIFEQNCIACHLGDNHNYPKTKRLNSKHFGFIKADRSCLECHRSTGHAVNIFSKSKFK